MQSNTPWRRSHANAHVHGRQSGSAAMGSAVSTNLTGTRRILSKEDGIGIFGTWVFVIAYCGFIFLSFYALGSCSSWPTPAAHRLGLECAAPAMKGKHRPCAHRFRDWGLSTSFVALHRDPTPMPALRACGGPRWRTQRTRWRSRRPRPRRRGRCRCDSDATGSAVGAGARHR